jgi:hypothetical protein
MMRFEALAILGLLTVAACQERQGDETGRAVDAADTVVTSEQNVDTTIVTQDTSVDVDTVRHEGDQPVSEDTLREDTLQEPSGTNAPSADTGSADTAQQ